MGGSNGEGDLRVAVEAGSRFLGEALAVLLRAEGVAVAPANGSRPQVDVVVLLVEGELGGSLAGVVSRVRDSYPTARILMLASGPLLECEGAAIALGVEGWLSCDASCARVADAVLELHSRGSLRHRRNDWPTARAEPDGLAGLLAQTTARESEILWLLVEGCSTDQIAADLTISPQTVRAHVQNLMAKLGAHSRVQLVRLARRAGMAPSDVVASEC